MSRESGFLDARGAMSIPPFGFSLSSSPEKTVFCRKQCCVSSYHFQLVQPSLIVSRQSCLQWHLCRQLRRLPSRRSQPLLLSLTCTYSLPCLHVCVDPSCSVMIGIIACLLPSVELHLVNFCTLSSTRVCMILVLNLLLIRKLQSPMDSPEATRPHVTSG